MPTAKLPALYLRVRAGGSRTFVIQWRQGQFQRRSTVGKVGILTVDEARRKARKLISGIDDGHDPIAAKAKARVDDRQLFGVLVDEYLAVRARDMKPRSLEQTTLHLRKHCEAPAQAAAEEDRPRDRRRRAADASQRREAPVAADRGRSTLSAFFGWAIGEGIAEVNPVIGTNKSSKGSSRERVLTDDELVTIWKAAPASDFGRIVKLLLLTGQRRNEIADLRWAEIEDGAIVLPRERTKNSREHDVPLSPQALAVLDEQAERVGREHVFGDGRRRLQRLLQTPRNGWTRPAASRAGPCTTCAAPRQPGWRIWACSLTSSRRF